MKLKTISSQFKISNKNQRKENLNLSDIKLRTIASIRSNFPKKRKPRNKDLHVPDIKLKTIASLSSKFSRIKNREMKIYATYIKLKTIASLRSKFPLQKRRRKEKESRKKLLLQLNPLLQVWWKVRGGLKESWSRIGRMELVWRGVGHFIPVLEFEIRYRTIAGAVVRHREQFRQAES